MKMSKFITIENVLGETVDIKPIEYRVARASARARVDQHFLLEEIGQKFLKGYNENNEELKQEAKELKVKYDEKEASISYLRNKYNYWYCGVLNLDEEEQEQFDLVKIFNKTE